jgi:hypothetical protein
MSSEIRSSDHFPSEFETVVFARSSFKTNKKHRESKQNRPDLKGLLCVYY